MSTIALQNLNLKFNLCMEKKQIVLWGSGGAWASNQGSSYGTLSWKSMNSSWFTIHLVHIFRSQGAMAPFQMH